MNGAAHLAGGLTAAVLLGQTSPAALAVAALASLLPDIDRPNSLLGRFIPVLPSLLEPVKRTVTHSLLLGGTLFLLLHAAAPVLALAFATGFLSHLLLDLPTGRVMLLWPLPVRFTLTFGIPPVFVEAAFLIGLGVWLALGGYHYFSDLFRGGPSP